MSQRELSSIIRTARLNRLVQILSNVLSRAGGHGLLATVGAERLEVTDSSLRATSCGCAALIASNQGHPKGRESRPTDSSSCRILNRREERKQRGRPNPDSALTDCSCSENSRSNNRQANTDNAVVPCRTLAFLFLPLKSPFEIPVASSSQLLCMYACSCIRSTRCGFHLITTVESRFAGRS